MVVPGHDQAWLHGAWERARRAWPGVELAFPAFRAHVLARVPARGSSTSLCTDDLYLARACIDARPHAIETLLAAFSDDLRRIVRRSGGEQTYDDFSQTFVEHVLLASRERPCRLTRYSGRGKLRYWLRVVAARLLADSLRAAGRASYELGDERLEVMPAPNDPPDTAYLRHHYRDEFEAAVRAAMAALAPSDRTLLRLRFVENLGLKAIAALLDVTRETVSRRLKDVRHALLWDVRDRLVAQLRLPAAEFESLFELLRSQLHLSLRLLAHSPG